MSIKELRHLTGKVIFGRGSIYTLKDLIENINPSKTGFIVDGEIYRMGLRWLKDITRDVKPELIYTVKDPRKAKNIEQAIDIWRELYVNEFNRKSLLVAIGGGGIGDLTGFISSTYMRGIDWINIPTTLLAQADSSIGGKTGIDFMGKNIIGSFHIPIATLIDPDLLDTLPKKLLIEGFSEIIKHSLISNGKLYRLLYRNSLERTLEDKRIFDEILFLSINFKLSIIHKDFKEKGLRRCLNFGHTVGHALEAYLDYNIPHGEAVSIGIALESYISRIKVGFDKYYEVLDILRRYKQRYGIDIDLTALIPWIKMDKKNWAGKPTFILLRDIGEWGVYQIEENELKEILNERYIQ